MPFPRWFVYLLAACAVALTAAATLHLRYVPAGEYWTVDAYRGRICNPGACFKLGRVVIDEKSDSARRADPTDPFDSLYQRHGLPLPKRPATDSPRAGRGIER